MQSETLALLIPFLQQVSASGGQGRAGGAAEQNPIPKPSLACLLFCNPLRRQVEDEIPFACRVLDMGKQLGIKTVQQVMWSSVSSLKMQR